MLRPAYKNWLIKDRLLRVQAQTIERNGMGIPLYKAQEGATGDDLIAGKNMATAWRAGEAAGSAVPFGADLVLRGVEGTLPDAEPAIRYHDEQIARAVLAHFLNLGTQTGSWALGTTFADFFTMSLQTLAEQIRDTATQHIVEDLVDINFGEGEPAPRLIFDEIGSRQAATADALKRSSTPGSCTRTRCWRSRRGSSTACRPRTRPQRPRRRARLPRHLTRLTSSRADRPRTRKAVCGR
jgi:phage gp29-like protein